MAHIAGVKGRPQRWASTSLIARCEATLGWLVLSPVCRNSPDISDKQAGRRRPELAVTLPYPDSYRGGNGGSHGDPNRYSKGSSITLVTVGTQGAKTEEGWTGWRQWEEGRRRDRHKMKRGRLGLSVYLASAFVIVSLPYRGFRGVSRTLGAAVLHWWPSD